MNVCIFMGNLTADPEVKSTPNGSTVANFRIAVNRYFNDASGNRKEEVTYISLEAWGKTAEFIGNHFSKGKAICVECRYRTRDYDKDGEKRTFHSFTVENAHFAGSGGGGNGNGGKVKPSQVQNDLVETTDEDDDIPF